MDRAENGEAAMSTNEHTMKVSRVTAVAGLPARRA
jgi:hypothetical protein